MDVVLIYLGLGLIVGILAGLFGVGGGLVIVPALVFIFSGYGIDSGVAVHLAIGTSLASIILTACASTLAHHRRQAVVWPACRRLTPGILFGAVLGAVLADMMPAVGLRKVFAVFEWLAALQLMFNFRPKARQALPGRWGMLTAGTVIGSVSSIIGIGGGTLTVPFLIWCDVVVQRAVATASACGIPIAVAGAVSFIVTGWNEQPWLPPYASGYVYWPAVAGIALTSMLAAPWGAALAHRLHAEQLRRYFALFLFGLGVYMFIQA